MAMTDGQVLPIALTSQTLEMPQDCIQWPMSLGKSEIDFLVRSSARWLAEWVMINNDLPRNPTIPSAVNMTGRGDLRQL